MIGAGEMERLRDELLAGGVAIVPTDTVYGLAAALDVPAGVEALYALKGRPRSQPCQALLFASAALDEALGALDERTRQAALALLPGPATCLLADPRGRYAAAAGASPGSVGVRAPAMGGQLAALELPLVATSANDPGGVDPVRLADVPEGLRAGVAAAIDAGPLPGTASAVVDLRGVVSGEPARLLRPGPNPGGVAHALGRVGVELVPGNAS